MLQRFAGLKPSVYIGGGHAGMRKIIGGAYADLARSRTDVSRGTPGKPPPPVASSRTQIGRVRSTWNTRCSTAGFLGHQEKSLAFHVKHLAYARRLC